ncbi:MAG: adenylate/guanylate cyclase domain-containing protein [Anaerolineae bacterium]|nr:adenylate/guanylate cyclase domain-containing protein [Anaerolineae bacterium]
MAKETVLVVDDGKDNRDFLVEYVLEPHGFRHLTAKDGEEGLKLAVQHKPDLILLDLQMPSMNGKEVLEHLAIRNIEIPVILMTFHGSEDIAIEVYRMGVKDYIKKPYYPDEMLDAMERALSETRLRHEKDKLTNRILQANQELQRRLKEFEALYNIGKVVTSTMDLSKLLPQVVDAAVQITDAEEGYITLLENKQLVRRAHKQPRLDRAQSVEKVVKDRVAGRVIMKNEALLLSEEQLRRGNNKPGLPISVASVPLIINERVLGALTAANYSDKAGKFGKNDMVMLNALSDYAAIAIENSRNYNTIRDSSVKMRDTFERFVAPSVVQQALSDDVKLGGKRQEISVVFADIRGYTAFSENAEPEKVLEMLNHYLHVAGGIIIGWEGTLDKFFGDGLMAIFNAPNKQADYVHRAAESALAIIQAAQEINQIYGYELAYSVGVHVGEAVVGYIGTSYAVNYTAIGDTVNLAKRLQETAAPNQILVDESVVKRLGAQVKAKLLGEITVKGRSKPSKAYELLELK